MSEPALSVRELMADKMQKARAFLGGRQRAYRIAFAGPVGEIVLADLAKFCRANETCFHADPRMHAVLEGRREVWLRISQHLNLSPDQLWRLLSQQQE